MAPHGKKTRFQAFRPALAAAAMMLAAGGIGVAAATTLLIAMGAFRPDWRDAAALSGGIVLIAALGTAIENELPAA